MPVVPLTRTMSPVLMSFVAIEVPTTAGRPNSRETTAEWEVVPPASVTSPEIRVKSTTQAGLVIRQTSTSPSSTLSNWSSVVMTRAFASMTPGEAASPVISPALVGGSR